MYDTSRYMSRPETVLMRAGHMLAEAQEAIVIRNPIHAMDDGQVGLFILFIQPIVGSNEL